MSIILVTCGFNRMLTLFFTLGQLSACMLQRLVHLREEVKEEGTSATLALSDSQLADLALKIHQLAAGPGAAADLSLLEDSLCLYLEMYPHHIGDLPKG